MTGNLILDSALVLGAVGLFFGFVIAMVNKKFRVWEDPRIDGVEDLLPSTNCGACGQPGCRAFAEAAVLGKVQPSECTVMGEEDIADVAAYLEHCLAQVGGRIELFAPSAIQHITRLSGGIPRKVARISELSLLAAAGQQLDQVDEETVSSVQQELSGIGTFLA